MNYLLAIGLSLLAIWYPGETYRFQNQLHLILAMCWIAWSMIIVFKVRAAIVLPALLVTGMSAASIFASPFTNYGDQAFTLDAISSQAALWVCLVVSLVSFASRQMKDIIFSAYEVSAMISAVLLLCGRHGLLGVPSVDSAFVAMVLPSLIFRKRHRLGTLILKVGLPILAISLSRTGATGIFALVGMILAYGVQTITDNRKSNTIALLALASCVLAVFVMGAILQGETLINSSGRVEMWKLCMQWWIDHVNLWEGTGLGTFQVLGIGIAKNANRIYGFTYMHNEYLQILFEQGIFGFVCVGSVFVFALLDAFKARSWLFLSLFTTAIVCLTQSPLRIPAASVFVALIVSEALRYHKSDEDRLKDDLLDQAIESTRFHLDEISVGLPPPAKRW